ncbi:MAG TPA: diguanylate cyclase [Candidatus Limnocylindrales bacterium]|nr:diguanylate cyclase [Candidatus Limnocylindrales bacterium]
MDQQTVTYLLIAALLATAFLIALAVIVPRMPRRGVGVMAAATAAAGAPMLADGDLNGGRAMSVANQAPSANGPSESIDEPSSDALTGLLSASRWTRVVADEDARIRRYRRSATIVMIELDGLDRLTARLGDGAAARLVPAVADTIQRLAREADFVARLGDSRFAVLLPETDEIQAINYVERVRRTCDVWLEAGAVALRLAMGWASASGEDSLHEAGRVATERMFAEIHRNARRTTDLVANGPAADAPESASPAG